MDLRYGAGGNRLEESACQAQGESLNGSRADQYGVGLAGVKICENSEYQNHTSTPMEKATSNTSKSSPRALATVKVSITQGDHLVGYHEMPCLLYTSPSPRDRG